MNHGDRDKLELWVASAIWKASDPSMNRLLPKHHRLARAAIEAVYAYQAEHGALPPRDDEA